MKNHEPYDEESGEHNFSAFAISEWQLYGGDLWDGYEDPCDPEIDPSSLPDDEVTQKSHNAEE